MKKLDTIIAIIALCYLSVMSQAQMSIDQSSKILDLKKIDKFLRSDANKHPYTTQEIQSYLDFLHEHPMIKKVNMTGERSNKEINLNQESFYEEFSKFEDLTRRKIDVIKHIFKNIKDPADKNKLTDFLLKIFPEIQAARAELGIKILSKDEGWLRMTPKPLPGESTQDWGNRISNEANRQIKSIETFEQLHTDIYRTLTEDMKVTIEGVPKVLERSPEEKARTKKILESYAAVHSRKKPNPKLHKIK